MAGPGQLFWIPFVLSILGGCASLGLHPQGAERAAPVESAGAAPFVPEPRKAAPANDTDLVFHALAAAGIDYHSGGKSLQTGFDCSGLVAFVYHEAYGLKLPHNSRAQSELGEAVERDSLRPGDLVFFNTLHEPFSHVGIYVGDGKFIHAPRKGRVVRTESMRARYWAARYDGARRLPPQVVHADYAGEAKRPLVTYP